MNVVNLFGELNSDTLQRAIGVCSENPGFKICVVIEDLNGSDLDAFMQFESVPSVKEIGRSPWDDNLTIWFNNDSKIVVVGVYKIIGKGYFNGILYRWEDLDDEEREFMFDLLGDYEYAPYDEKPSELGEQDSAALDEFLGSFNVR